MENMMSKLQNLDAYPKTSEDFYSRTLSGGVITLASSIVGSIRFFTLLRLICRVELIQAKISDLPTK
ncbi:unnamed protein product [Prunus brigantina]